MKKKRCAFFSIIYLEKNIILSDKFLTAHSRIDRRWYGIKTVHFPSRTVHWEVTFPLPSLQWKGRQGVLPGADGSGVVGGGGAAVAVQGPVVNCVLGTLVLTLQ